MAETFGEYIKKLRKDRKMTLREVERKTGISNSYLSQVERGKRGLPNHEFIIRISSAYGVSTNEISNKAIENTKGKAILDKANFLAVLTDSEEKYGTITSTTGEYVRGRYLQLDPGRKNNLVKYLHFLCKEWEDELKEKKKPEEKEEEL